ncbi:MAG: peptidoglycan DD-metalloendopeptidase family protein [Deltaproteobacteria bacterium]|nr:peptidoglycan DD-metalloendopeptidase family protein [Deltaproteobacteria bacterium]
MRDIDAGAGTRERRPFLVATLVAITLFFAALFLISPNAFSYKGAGLPESAIGSAKPIVSSSLGASASRQVRRYDFRIDNDQTFSSIMALFNVPPSQVNAITAVAMPFYDLGLLQRDTVIRIFTSADETWQRLDYAIGPYQVLNVERDPSVAGAVKAWISELPHETRIIKVSGVIENSLYEDAVGAGADAGAIMDLSDIFAWDVDFAVDIRKGDRFSLLYEALYVDGRSIKTGRVLGAEMENDGRRITAVYFHGGGSKKPGYYDESGASLSRTLLKSPLRYRRISSYFSRNRFHPILKKYRPHHGIDYSAPTGTPVEAAGGGRITFAGWKSGYGNFIEVKHHNSYSTGYGHLSKIRSGIRKGVSVDQGDVIGYVGSTGISTGPHLHYEVRQGGRVVNPLGLKSEPKEGVAKADKPAFAALAAEVIRQLGLPDAAVSIANGRFTSLSRMASLR